ncbi:hypothetical protein HNR21_005172 [Actinomadura cellulosilytica]|uniref:Uncharacterized protein n=1 Tax=Thermomonospora cellulosilytica TaxID=1411118 RepID=A0A7W3N2F5_9ACTN|nr:hypothetical protein [Thermomonospora cellulosilytica]
MLQALETVRGVVQYTLAAIMGGGAGQGDHPPRPATVTRQPLEIVCRHVRAGRFRTCAGAGPRSLVWRTGWRCRLPASARREAPRGVPAQGGNRSAAPTLSPPGARPRGGLHGTCTESGPGLVLVCGRADRLSAGLPVERQRRAGAGAASAARAARLPGRLEDVQKFSRTPLRPTVGLSLRSAHDPITTTPRPHRR